MELLLRLLVRFNVEARKQEQEADDQERQNNRNLLWHVAVQDRGDSENKNHSAELDQLQSRQIFFPPEELLHLRSQCTQQIVRVHDNMHKRVHEANGDALFPECVLQVVVCPKHHYRMMVDVQKSHLVLVLAQHKEHGVQKFSDFRNVIPIGAGVELQMEISVD